MSTIVRNEADLDTLLDENLVTEDYALEILGLKNIADFRKFSRSFMKLSKIVKGIDDSNNEKLDKGDYTGNAKNLNDEISKKASKTVLGRMLVGDNLTVDENGRVSGNPTYTHPTGAGNNHIPAGGSIGQVLKNSGNGVATWGDMDLGNYYTKTETDEKFKNFCPYAVGDVYVTTSTTNPATRWTGTTWQKIEGRFLLGTSGSGASKATGGSNSKTITQANLPNVKLTVNSFSLSVTKPNLYGRSDAGTVASRSGIYANVENGVRAIQTTTGKAMNLSSALDNTTTSTASPQTSALGSGSALDVTPAYYTCHMWLRLT